MKHRKTSNKEYNYKRIHTFNYVKLSNGNRPYRLIRMKVWLWGFGVTIETKKILKGLVLNSRKATPRTLADKYVYKVKNK